MHAFALRKVPDLHVVHVLPDEAPDAPHAEYYVQPSIRFPKHVDALALVPSAYEQVIVAPVPALANVQDYPQLTV